MMWSDMENSGIYCYDHWGPGWIPFIIFCENLDKNYQYTEQYLKSEDLHSNPRFVATDRMLTDTHHGMTEFESFKEVQQLSHLTVKGIFVMTNLTVMKSSFKERKSTASESIPFHF